VDVAEEILTPSLWPSRALHSQGDHSVMERSLESGPRMPARGAVYTVCRHHGVPAFCADGRPLALPSYCSCGPGWWDEWLAAHRNFAAHGRRVYWLMPTGGYNGEWGTTPFWTAPGQVNDPPAPMPADYHGLGEQAEAILALVPEARFFVRMNDLPPASWGRAYPDDMLLNYRGKRYENASLASDRYQAEFTEYLRTLTRYCERQPWADRLIGYVIYPLGEGATPLACQGYLFDQSPVMQAKFAEFRRGRGRPAVAVPGDEDFRRRGGSPVLFWPGAARVEAERDYFDLQTQLFERHLRATLRAFRAAAPPGRLCGIDAFKGNMVGWMTHPIFTGRAWREHYGDQFLATGTTNMHEMLDWPELDLVATPHDYRCRWAGFGYDPEGIGDSVQLHGKLMLVEEDQRSYANRERGLFGSIEPGEEAAILFRNEAAALSKGQQNYPMDVCVGYFGEEPIQQALARCGGLAVEFLAVPRQEVPCVTMLVDPRAARHTDFSCEYNDLAVIRQRLVGMNHCGVPTRTFLFDDLGRDDFPECHRLFLLPNAYLADEATAARLRSRLFRNGNVIVCGPGSGITDGVTVAPEHAARLLGMDFELYDYEYPRFVTIDNWRHPLTAGAGACETFGDTHRYGPVLVPWERGAPVCHGGVPPRQAQAEGDGGFVRLGTMALDNGKRRPGLVVKEFGRGAAGNGRPGRRGPGDYAIVFAAAVPLPAWLLRNLARFSGTHVYDDEEDVVYADSRMVAVHAVRPGPRTLVLPGRCAMRDLLAADARPRIADRIAFEVSGPVTRWWALSPAPGREARPPHQRKRPRSARPQGQEAKRARGRRTETR